jgi:trans-aconitate methyltransferase
MTVDWHEVWERKGSAEVAGYDLSTLLELDGYDTGMGMGAAAFQHLVDLVLDELPLEPGTRLLDVGCGAGALLWCLRDRELVLFGVDYSSTLIEHARRALPEASFAVAEATDLPFVADVIVCHSVFPYFPSFDYAQRVLAGFRRAAPIALVMDIPDLAKKEANLEARRRSGSKPGDHLYYEKGFFAPARIWDVDVPGYGNAPFRFDALFDARLAPWPGG